jgi:uncharacterized membrane protein YhaH (DUF805 family)
MQEMSPIDWAVRPLKRYADFSGRAPRAEYWWFWLGYVVLTVLLQTLTRISSVLAILGLFYLGLIIPMIAVGVRRLHDTNRTGWWLLAPAVPYAIGIALLIPNLMSGQGPSFGSGFGAAVVFMLVAIALALVVFVFNLLPGTRGPNRFGPDPYDEENFEEVFA